MSQRPTQTLEPRVNMIKFPLNAWVHFKADQSLPWVTELLKELNEKATDKTPDEWVEETTLDIQLEAMKRFKNETGDFLLVRGSVFTAYVTECVRTLKTLKLQLEVEIRACFMLEETLQLDEYKDAEETFQEGENYTLYPYSKGSADVAEMLHEQLFLHVEPYPRCEDPLELDVSFESDKTRQ